ncbi:MAG TPA: hypothetical protein VFZ41_09335 [Solirubrobacterales bacterium]
MKLKVFALIVGVFALTATPAFAGKPDGTPSKGQGTTKAPTYTPGEPTPGPKAGLPAKAKAYGRYCKGSSKKKQEGQKRSDFSLCVTAMARVANNGDLNPRKACQGMSKKREAGQKGTDFSICVREAAKLKRQQRQEEKEQTESA